MRSKPPDWRGILVAIVTAIVAIGAVSLVASSDEDDAGKHHRTVTISLGKPVTPSSTRTTPTSVEVPATAVAQAQASDVGDHEGLRSEHPPGATAGELEDALEQQEALAATDDLPTVTPDAAPSQAGCATRLVRNYSSRRGVRPRLLVAHYTVSPNRPGWSDVWSVVALFDRPAFAASSTYVIDGEGHCAYIVRESDKPWTNAAANPVTITAELINTGREPVLLAAAGMAKLGRVFADAARRWDIPLQLGKVSGCTVTRPGIIDHKALGACGGGHVDVSPYSVTTVIRAATLAARSAGRSATSDPLDDATYELAVLTAGERSAARCLLAERRVAHRHHGWAKIAPAHLRRAGVCKRTLQERNAELHRLGLTARAERARRHAVIHRVV